jgi:hypothetical protein
MTTNDADIAKRSRIRRTTILLALVALGFYVGFILMNVMGARS